MWNTGNAPATKTPSEIAQWILLVARAAPGGRLRNVVFSCHGSPGQIHIGTGIALADVPKFSRLVVDGRPLVDKFWFRCCSIARAPAGGHGFCRAFARTTKAYVVASTETQWSRPRTLPFGRLDGFEGLVLSYGPSGRITWQRRYTSGWTAESWFDRLLGRGRTGKYETPLCLYERTFMMGLVGVL